MEATENVVLCPSDERERLVSELAAARQAAEGWECEVERVRLLAARSLSDARREIETLQSQLRERIMPPDRLWRLSENRGDPSREPRGDLMRAFQGEPSRRWTARGGNLRAMPAASAESTSGRHRFRDDGRSPRSFRDISSDLVGL
jgi:hypothetical protein